MDVMEVVTELAVALLKTDCTKNPVDEVKQAVESGAALQKLEALVEAHHGDPSHLHAGQDIHSPRCQKKVLADKSGIIVGMDTESIGRSVNHLTVVENDGARQLDPSGGVSLEKKLGEEVREGEMLALCFGGDKAKVELSARQLYSAIFIGEAPVESPTMIL